MQHPVTSPTQTRWRGRGAAALIFLTVGANSLAFASAPSSTPAAFPRPLDSYGDASDASVSDLLKHRIDAEPLNLVAAVIFLLAIAHTFLAPKFTQLAHHLETRHRERLAKAGELDVKAGRRREVSFVAEACHLLGEVEAIFGIWVVPLMLAITAAKGWTVARDYLGGGLDFTEPLFVVIVMTIAASRPVLDFAEGIMSLFAKLGRGSPAAWWMAILTIGPVLGSFITEPAAMTISALLLADRFYRRAPSATFAYATLGLLFVNVSVGGTLTHFAAPPVLMVAGKWGWDTPFMLAHFGWKAVVAIAASNLVYLGVFGRELRQMATAPPVETTANKEENLRPVPYWVTAVHIFFLVWTVINSHFPALFIGGFLFYLAFTRATEHHQSELALRPALLVGFFLAGLVVHGGLQGWWIAPVLSRLNELPLFFGAAGLTAFNDNAAITYLASLVPGFSDSLRYAVMAGAVAGGGLTVIANAPNPAGQSILSAFFPGGISPLRLFLGALAPTALVFAAFLLLK